MWALGPLKKVIKMAITIIVEDGTGKEDSNSYIDVEYAKTYASNRNVILPDNDNEIAAMLINSSDYIESKECKFSGERTNENQALSWPRKNAMVNCKPFADNQIPKQLKDAQAALVIVVNSGVDLFSNYGPSDYITEETIGPITTKYADPVEVGMTKHFGAADALLNKLYNGGCGCGMSLTTRRV